MDPIWYIPLLPFLGFFLNLFFGPRLGKRFVGITAVGVVAAAFVLALLAVLRVAQGSEHFIAAPLLDWIRIPGLSETGSLEVLVRHELWLDPLSSVMILVVTGVGGLIHLFSTGYMADEKRYSRYFAYLNLFTGFMLILVMAKNLLLMFVGWEGVGLCSYLLIGFWFERVENAAAGMKAFIVNRVGDFGFTIGLLILFVYLGSATGVWTVDFVEIKNVLETHHVPEVVLTVVGILLFVGAAGKSAQIPLYVWLPDAMAGPTPVSALIHAATMVTAGVYMIARLNFIYIHAPIAQAVVAGTGALTAIFAATIGICQTDIKKVLAYSTVSQLGYMFVGVGVGAFAVGIFHLMTHAFFKACLFLGSGSVIHGCGGEQDIRKMGGLKKLMPITFATFFISTLAIAGIPPFAGFFSKDEILWQAFTTDVGHRIGFEPFGKIVWGLCLVGAGITAFYMFRLVYVAFYGEYRGAKGEGHGHGQGHGQPADPDWRMWVPLVVLATLAVVGGFVGVPAVLAHAVGLEGAWFEHALGSVFGSHHAEGDASHGMELGLMALSVGIALFGWWLARECYVRKPALPRRFAERCSGLYDLVLNKYRVDETYQEYIVEPLIAFNEGVGRFDNGVIDGTVNRTASETADVSQTTGYFDNEVVDGGVNGTADFVQGAGRTVRRLQTGNIKAYLTTALVGALFVIAVFCTYLSKDRIVDWFWRMGG